MHDRESGLREGGGYGVKGNEAERVVGCKVVDQRHHAVLGHLQLVLRIIYRSNTRDKSSASHSEDEQREGGKNWGFCFVLGGGGYYRDGRNRTWNRRCRAR